MSCEKQIEKNYTLFPIILKEDERLPIEKLIKIEQKESSKTITSEDSSVCSHLSTLQQKLTATKIDQVEHFYKFIQKYPEQQNSLQQQKQEENQEKQEELEQTRSVIYEKLIPSCFLGAGNIGNSNYENDYEYDRLTLPASFSRTESDNNNDGNTISEITYCLLYQDESKEELSKTINRIQHQSLGQNLSVNDNNYSGSIFIFINGSQQFEQILKDHLNSEDQNKIETFFHDYSTSENHAYFVEIQDVKQQQNCQPMDVSSQQLLSLKKPDQQHPPDYIYYLIFPQVLNKVQLLRWVFKGILIFIDPTYAVVSNSDEDFKCDFLVKCLSKIHVDDNYFGLQWKKTIEKSRLNRFRLQNLARILQNDDTSNQIDGMFSIKKMHDQWHCIYKWKHLKSYIDEYWVRLSTQSKNQNVCYGYNSILTELMFNKTKKMLYYLADSLSVSKSQNDDYYACLTVLGNNSYDYQNQLAQPVTTNRSRGFGVIQSFYNLIEFLLSYFSLSIIIFFSFHSPYQIISTVFHEKKEYTAIAIILPFLYVFDIILLLLFFSFYKFSSVITTKEQKLLVKKTNNEGKNPQYYYLYQKKATQTEVKKLQSLNLMLGFLQVLDTLTVVATMTNIILNYGGQFLHIKQTYQLIVIIYAILQLLFLIKKGWICGFHQISIVSIISKYYIFLQASFTAEITIAKKRSAALQILLNYLALNMYNIQILVALSILNHIIIIRDMHYYRQLLFIIVKCYHCYKNRPNSQEIKIVIEKHQEIKQGKMNKSYDSILLNTQEFYKIQQIKINSKSNEIECSIQKSNKIEQNGELSQQRIEDQQKRIQKRCREGSTLDDKQIVKKVKQNLMKIGKQQHIEDQENEN